MNWRGNYTDNKSRLMRCMQCGKSGHFKCMSEKESHRLRIDTRVRDDLSEFKLTLLHRSASSEEGGEPSERSAEESERQLRYSFDYANEDFDSSAKKKNNGVKKMRSEENIEGTNLWVGKKRERSESKEEESDSWGQVESEEDLGSKRLIPKGHEHGDLYCGKCGGRHHE